MKQVFHLSVKRYEFGVKSIESLYKRYFFEALIKKA